jgi:hypothetical protein
VPWVALLAVLIWFCPLDPLYRPQLGYGGAPGYMALFAPDAPWQAAAARTGVFKIYPQWAEQATDEQLRTQFGDLKRRHIALAIEYAVLTASPQCGTGVESFGGDHLAAVALRIKRLGGTLAYLAMDEPFFWSTLYTGPNACHWAPDVMAANAAVNLRALRAVFPKVSIGDVEPAGFSNTLYIEHYEACIHAFEKAAGFAPAFFHLDEAWDPATFPADVLAIHRMLERERIPLGIIVNADGSESSDATWIAAAREHLNAFEAALGVPDQIVFQSWNRFPQTLLPESDPDAFTWLLEGGAP